MQNLSFFPELNLSLFRHFVYLHVSHISYPDLLPLFAEAAILNKSPSSLRFWSRDLLCARVFSRAANILKSEKTLGTRFIENSVESTATVYGFIRATAVSRVLFLNLISFPKNAARRTAGESRSEVFFLKKIS